MEASWAPFGPRKHECCVAWNRSLGSVSSAGAVNGYNRIMLECPVEAVESDVDPPAL